jgi:hypothetical protein
MGTYEHLSRDEGPAVRARFGFFWCANQGKGFDQLLGLSKHTLQN